MVRNSIVNDGTNFLIKGCPLASPRSKSSHSTTLKSNQHFQPFGSKPHQQQIMQFKTLIVALVAPAVLALAASANPVPANAVAAASEINSADSLVNLERRRCPRKTCDPNNVANKLCFGKKNCGEDGPCVSCCLAFCI
ncbi:uncharacterized protein SPPG_02537 [Spizellomyces punctatus DAOM BR117]|uniref:Uncharacterized protein n=1 Tax=Spizellomyces punctatus (strain DAOM BR117) TaxID=645134 RepID=A0A0L0HMI9_SPIPD|nr:uncharacterized protein SPPG_02537 [Spizellomyces punctatus DAOM BR117]KND02034.1 hypothetical protein SPPG_02537 [Spizellomyces punctatus DAOM BR117]|eukprot:XP_016610073.1 hypothetical protein SPPG_02537 [Spizellomyces punctatus DAOM BR117]